MTVDIMKKSIMLDLNMYMNNRGFTTLDDITEGNLSVVKSSLPILPELKNVFYFKNVPYKLCYGNKKDNIELDGQTIFFEQIYKTNQINIVGLCLYGDYFDDLNFYLNGKLVKSVKISLSCCNSKLPAFKNETFFHFPYTHNAKKWIIESYINLWLDEIFLDEVIAFDMIELGDNPCMHIFAITILNDTQKGDEEEWN